MDTLERTRNYLELIELDRVQLVILGKDAYPTDSTGVAFCKPTWGAQIKPNCSGLFVLQALGVDYAAEKQRVPERPPLDLFERLAHSGVVFLNASYSTEVGKRFTKTANLPKLTEAYGVNKAIIGAAKNVIRCGEARRMDWVPDSDTEKKYFDVVHPDKRNSFNKWTKDRWGKLWATPGSLAAYWPNKPNNIILTKPARSGSLVLAKRVLP